MLRIFARRQTDYIPFDEVKQLADIIQVASWLDIDLKRETSSHRGPCPLNQGEPRELVVTPSKGYAYCYGCKQPDKYGKRGGDQIWLTAHIKQVSRVEAAHLIKQYFGNGYVPPPKDTRGLPADGFTDLLPLHPRVQALGLTPERAAELAIGFRNRGTTKDAVCIPFRDQTGKLLGYMLVDKDGKLRLPKQMLA